MHFNCEIVATKGTFAKFKGIPSLLLLNENIFVHTVEPEKRLLKVLTEGVARGKTAENPWGVPGRKKTIKLKEFSRNTRSKMHCSGYSDQFRQ